MTRKIIKAINVGVDTVDCPLVAGGSVGAYRVGMGTADIEWLSTKGGSASGVTRGRCTASSTTVSSSRTAWVG